MLYFMRKKIFLIVFLLSLIFLLYSCDDGPGISPLPPDAVILSFGDSITHGTGAAKDQSYPSLLEQLTGYRVINAGVPGETTEGGVARLAGLLEKHRPNLVILCEGGNDFLRRRSTAKAKENLDRMIQQIRYSGADVILLGVPQLGLFLESSPIYEELATHHEIPLLAEVLPDILGDRDLKSDQIHPNAAGYRQLAERIAEAIDDLQAR
ncbi:MAG: arylesterase [Desulfuromonas sp.]|nr:MAG: arylesterase [Desulfuromonas sp.]